MNNTHEITQMGTQATDGDVKLLETVEREKTIQDGALVNADSFGVD